MWTHQYDQQVNQIACTRFEKQPFRTNDADANIFGLEPNYGCCTANFGQGFPKFLLSAYMKKGEALVIISPLPAEIRFGADNTVTVRSEYPFRNKFSLYTQHDTQILLRIPGWATPECGESHTVKDGWMSFTAAAGREVTIVYRTRPELHQRPGNRYCLKYGALLYALPVKGEKRKHEYVRNGVERKYPYCDYEILPTGEWRYAFAGGGFCVKEREYTLPFDRESPPVVIETRLTPVEWRYAEGMPLVASPEAGTKRRGPEETLCLQPYGSTDLRVTEMALSEDVPKRGIEIRIGGGRSE